MVTLNVRAWKSSIPQSPRWLPEARQEVLWEEYQTQSGIKLLVQNLPSLDKPARFTFEIDAAPVEFMYCLSGRTDLHIKDRSGQTFAASTSAGTCTCPTFPAPAAHSRCTRKPLCGRSDCRSTRKRSAC